jgi:uncharacterized protein (DUF433 family)
MTALEKVTALLPGMSSSDILQVMLRAAEKIGPEFPGIVKTAGVCGGSACVIRTRIPVWSLVEYIQLGVSNDAILINFPTLRTQDLTNAWAYYQAHKAEIDAEIVENRED